MEKGELPVLPKGWRKSKDYADYKEVIVEKDKKNVFIKVEDVELNAVYRTHVKDLVKVLVIDEERKKFKLYNISGAFSQWTEFKNIAFVEKVLK